MPASQGGFVEDIKLILYVVRIQGVTKNQRMLDKDASLKFLILLIEKKRVSASQDNKLKLSDLCLPTVFIYFQILFVIIMDL